MGNNSIVCPQSVHFPHSRAHPDGSIVIAWPPFLFLFFFPLALSCIVVVPNLVCFGYKIKQYNYPILSPPDWDMDASPPCSPPFPLPPSPPPSGSRPRERGGSVRFPPPLLTPFSGPSPVLTTAGAGQGSGVTASNEQRPRRRRRRVIIRTPHWFFTSYLVGFFNQSKPPSLTNPYCGYKKQISDVDSILITLHISNFSGNRFNSLSDNCCGQKQVFEGPLHSLFRAPCSFPASCYPEAFLGLLPCNPISNSSSGISLD